MIDDDPADPYQWVADLVGAANVRQRRVGPNPISATGRLSTSKAPEAQQYESLLERDFVTLLDADRRVEQFATQPISIPWKGPRGRTRRYTPDVIVRYTAQALAAEPGLKHTVFEVKPSAIIRRKWAELKPQWLAARAFCRRHGLAFRIINEARLDAPYLKNLRFLRRYRRQFMDEHTELVGERQWALLRALYDLGTSTPAGLLAKVTADRALQAELLPWLWQLVNLGRIGVDLTKPLTMASPIWTLEDRRSMGLDPDPHATWRPAAKPRWS